MMLPVCSAVLCSMTTWDGAVQDLKERAAAAPARAADVLEQVVPDRDAPRELARPHVVAAEDIDPRARVRRTMLLANVTSSTVDHGAAPSWLRTVKSTAKPFCDWSQLPSRRLPSMTTRRAFLSSSRFFTAHALPS